MHNRKKLAALALAAGAAVGLTAGPAAAAGPPRDDDGNRVRTVVYVESQGLFYESIVGPDLNGEGRYQKLDPTGGPGGTASTEFGPGDPGYVGGRWWVDVNGDDVMDDGDVYFSCPLLGQGSATHP